MMCAIALVSCILKVSDYGMSPFKTFGTSLVTAGQGSPMYNTLTHQAPEVLLNNEVSLAGDVYSFGVLMWQVSALTFKLILNERIRRIDLIHRLCG